MCLYCARHFIHSISSSHNVEGNYYYTHFTGIKLRLAKTELLTQDHRGIRAGAVWLAWSGSLQPPSLSCVPGLSISRPAASLVVQTMRNLPAMQETWVQSLGLEDPLEKGMATHSSILAWRIPGTEEPGGLQSMGLQRVGHNLAVNCIFDTAWVSIWCP